MDGSNPNGSTTDKSKMYETFEPPKAEKVETVTQPEGNVEPKVETSTQLTDEQKEFEEFKKNRAHFQSVAERQRTELEKEKEAFRIQAIEEKIRRENLEKQLNPVVEIKPPVEPVEPIQPPDFDMVDALDPNTSSGKYQRQYNNYIKDLARYVKESRAYEQTLKGKESEELKSYLDEVKHTKQVELERQMWVKAYQDEGLSAEDANKAFQLFSSKDLTTPKSHVQVYKLLNQKNDNPVFKAPETVMGTKAEIVDQNHYFKRKDPSWMLKT